MDQFWSSMLSVFVIIDRADILPFDSTKSYPWGFLKLSFYDWNLLSYLYELSKDIIF